MKNILFAIYIVIFILIFFSCNSTQSSGENSSYVNISDQITENTVTISEDMQILSDGTTLNILSGYLKIDKSEVIKILEDQTPDICICDNFESYYYEDLGITLYCNDDIPEKFSYIECNKDHVCIEGIKNLNFLNIQKVFGSKKVEKLQNGLPDLYTFVLYYQIGTCKIMFSASDTNGDDAQLIITNDFDRKHGFTNIGVDQINLYFNMTKEEIQEKLGAGLSSDHYIEYNDYGVCFYFFQDNSLEQILFSDNYQIEGLRAGMKFKDIMEILGEKEVQKVLTSEDGDLYYLEYPLETFNIRIDSFNADGSEGGFYIFSNKEEFSNLYNNK